jgi:hypothetical protein
MKNCYKNSSLKAHLKSSKTIRGSYLDLEVFSPLGNHQLTFNYFIFFRELNYVQHDIQNQEQAPIMSKSTLRNRQ